MMVNVLAIGGRFHLTQLKFEYKYWVQESRILMHGTAHFLKWGWHYKIFRWTNIWFVVLKLKNDSVKLDFESWTGRFYLYNSCCVVFTSGVRVINGNLKQRLVCVASNIRGFSMSTFLPGCPLHPLKHSGRCTAQLTIHTHRQTHTVSNVTLTTFQNWFFFWFEAEIWSEQLMRD